jgi:hypothetical protein
VLRHGLQSAGMMTFNIQNGVMFPCCTIRHQRRRFGYRSPGRETDFFRHSPFNHFTDAGSKRRDETRSRTACSITPEALHMAQESTESA